jgi:hypothetical protein
VTRTLDVPVADFERLAHGWLIVGRCGHHDRLLGPPTVSVPHLSHIGLACLDCFPELKPDDLVALVGKACETCDGKKKIKLQHPIHVTGTWTIKMYGPCLDCLGSGSALLTVMTECGWCNWPMMMYPGCDCTDGTRSVRVRLTGQPLPIVGPHSQRTEVVEFIQVLAAGAFHRRITLDDGFVQQIDLGSDPATLIGRWAFPVERLDV